MVMQITVKNRWGNGYRRIMELPIAFETRMKKLLGDGYDAFYVALRTEEAVKGLRANTNKVSVDSLEASAPFPLTSLPYFHGGYIIPDEAQAGKHPYHHAGAYYMQDPGAMASVAALPNELWEREDLKILDLCAAPGGKTTQLASLCAPHGGAVLANEYNAARSRILAGNVERMGLGNVCVTNLDSKYIAQWYPHFFDLVVVDAPCSGEGMFRKNDLAISEWSLDNVQMCAVRQKEILENASACVATGGFLLYSTCTYSTEENEETVAEFLFSHSDFQLLPCNPAVIENTSDGIDVTGGDCPELKLCRRFYPHISRGEGQFVALLKRNENASDESKPTKDTAVQLGKRELSVVEDFLKETLGHTLPGLCLCGGNVAAFAPREFLGFPLPSFGLVAAGVTVGELRKDRLVPHHHFFTAYGKEMYSTCTFAPDDESVARYLVGEEISVPADCKGYTAVLLQIGEEAVTLGGGKAVNGKLKNYYPKGLRTR